MIRRPPRSTLFPTRRSSDLNHGPHADQDPQHGQAGTYFVGGDGADSRTGVFAHLRDRKSTRLNSSHLVISYAVFCLKKKKKTEPGSQQSIHYVTSIRDDIYV